MSDDATAPASVEKVSDTGPIQLGRLSGALVLIAIILAALNLRAAVTSIGPVLAEMRASLGMSAAVAGLLTALPAACYVVFGALTPRIVSRTFPSRLLCYALAATTIGMAIRPFVPTAGWFIVFSCLALGGIGVGNIMMPVIVRLAFPRRIGPVTGAFSMGLALGSGVAAAATVPLTAALGGDWRLGLAAWALPALLATICWLVVSQWVRHQTGGRMAGSRKAPLPMRRSPTAWAVAVLFGMQSTQAYVTIGWVPQIYRDAGLSPTYAGALLALIFVTGVPMSLLVPTIAARMRSQSMVAVGLTVLGFVGYLGLLFVPSTLPWLWVVILGISQTVFPLVLTMIGLRSRTGPGTVGLSAFGQSVGYLLSLPWPIVVGAIYGATGNWTWPLILLMGLLVPQAIAGYFAGRRRFVEDDLDV